MTDFQPLSLDKTLADHYYIDNEKCNGQGCCEPQCPVEAIFNGFDDAYFIDYDECIQCGYCAAICPEEAVSHISY